MTAAAAGKEIQKMSTVSQVANARPARMSAVRVLNIVRSFREGSSVTVGRTGVAVVGAWVDLGVGQLADLRALPDRPSG
jgi:hypothetical protein